MNKIALHLQDSHCGEGCTSKQAGCGGIVVTILFARLGSNETLGQGSALESAHLSPRLDVRCSMLSLLTRTMGRSDLQKFQSCDARVSRVLFWEKAGTGQTVE